MMATLLMKEWRGLWRDGRALVLMLAMLLMLAAVSAAAIARRDTLARETMQVEAASHRQFETQGDKHPHRGAHFGHYAFRAPSWLAAFDPGLTPWVGQALWLEPHRRNLARFSPAADAPPLHRLGDLTPAFLLIVMAPMLVIALAFDAVSGERERGLLRMSQGVGLSAGRLLGAKFALLSGLVAMLLASTGLVFVAGGSLTKSISGDEAWRAAALLAAHAVYGVIVAALATAVSAFARSSRLALFMLVASWAVGVLAMPRLASATAERLVPLPAAASLWADIHRDYTQGLPGDGSLAERGRRFDAQMLAEHRVARLEDLPFGVSAARRLQRDAYADRVHALHLGALWRRYEQQQAITRAFAWLSPAVAIRSLSMALAGTDLAHQRHFEDAAEAYRREVNTRVDRWDRERTRGFTSFDAAYADDGLWQAIPPFTHRHPGIDHALKEAWPDALALAAWAVAAGAALVIAARRLAP